MSTSLRERLVEAVTGRYTIGAELGRGGMSVIFEARPVDAEAPVALKLLLPEIASIIGAERFHQEIAFLRRLDHPRIVPILDSSQTGPLLFYTMPRLSGETLRDRLGRLGAMPLDQVRAIAGDVAAALDHAHSRNILHRDIKPENVLLDGDRALVCDFGVARAIERAGGERFSSSGILLGTPGYMSPEQARGEADLDARCDIYGFGCLLFELLAGEPAFTGRSAQSIIARQAAGEPRSLGTVRPDLPGPVEAAIRKAMARDRRDRPPRATLLLEQLLG